jgi:hypothetical protein
LKEEFGELAAYLAKEKAPKAVRNAFKRIHDAYAKRADKQATYGRDSHPVGGYTEANCKNRGQSSYTKHDRAVRVLLHSSSLARSSSSAAEPHAEPH